MYNVEKTGELVHGEYPPTVGTGGEIVLYTRDGAVRALAATERLEVMSVYMNNTVESLVTLFCDTNADSAVTAGERVIALSIAARGGAVWKIKGFVSALGAKPRVLASAEGTVSAGLTGYIWKD